MAEKVRLDDSHGRPLPLLGAGPALRTSNSRHFPHRLVPRLHRSNRPSSSASQTLATALRRFLKWLFTIILSHLRHY